MARSSLQKPDKFVFNKSDESFYDITPFGTTKVYHLDSFYKKLKEKYMDRKNTIFFYEMIENLCLDRTIEPSYFIECYNNDCLEETGIIEKYNKSYNDIYSIASNIIDSSNINKLSLKLQNIDLENKPATITMPTPQIVYN